MLAENVSSHQRGSGLLSSSMPSHSWPTVSTPWAASMRGPPSEALVFRGSVIVVVPEHHFGGSIVCGSGAGPERPEHAGGKANRHGDQAPTVSELTKRFVGGGEAHRPFSVARSSWAAALFTSTMVPITWR